MAARITWTLYGLNQMVIANVGVPMIFWQLPAMLTALPVVIAIEVLVAKYVYKISLGPSVAGVSFANLVSTVIGIPLAWGAMLGLSIVTTGTGAMGMDTPLGIFQSVVLQSSWLVPYREQLYWMVPTATLVLLVPYYFASVYSERLVLRFIWTDVPNDIIRNFSWTSNLWSYAGFSAYTCVWLAYATLAV